MSFPSFLSSVSVPPPTYSYLSSLALPAAVAASSPLCSPPPPPPPVKFSSGHDSLTEESSSQTFCSVLACRPCQLLTWPDSVHSSLDLFIDAIPRLTARCSPLLTSRPGPAVCRPQLWFRWFERRPLSLTSICPKAADGRVSFRGSVRHFSPRARQGNDVSTPLPPPPSDHPCPRSSASDLFNCAPISVIDITSSPAFTWRHVVPPVLLFLLFLINSLCFSFFFSSALQSLFRGGRPAVRV